MDAEMIRIKMILINPDKKNFIVNGISAAIKDIKDIRAILLVKRLLNLILRILHDFLTIPKNTKYSIRTKEITDLFLKSSPPKNNRIFLDMIKYAHLPPIMPRYNEMNDTMYRELDYFWLNKKPIYEVLQNLEKQLNKFLEKR